MHQTDQRTTIPAIRVSISTKIFAVATGLLLLMAAVSLMSLYRVNRVNQEVVDIAANDIPLTRYLTTVRMLAFQQEMTLERMLRLYAAAQPDTQTLSEHVALFRSLGQQVDDEIASAIQLVQRGFAEAANTSDRIELASLQPLLQAVEHAHEDFQQHGLRLMTLLEQRQHAVAQYLQEMLDEEQKELNGQMTAVLEALQSFTLRSAQHAKQHENQVVWFNLIMTIVATALGVIGALCLTTGLVRPVRRLVAGTQTVQQGHLDVAVQVTSRDEIGLLTSSFNQMVQDLRMKERIKETFGKYIDPRIVDDLIERPEVLEESGQRRVMTVLFCDIAGFTTISERLTPRALVGLVNRYLSMMSQPIIEARGVIDKYIGDAIMAFWGPPFTSPNQHASAACLAALEMFTCLETFRQTLPDVLGMRQNLPDIRIRIGIATGEVIVGNIGSEVAKSYTVIGDTVNLASRLEGANKAYHTQVLISEATYAMMADVVETREIDAIRVVGKSEPVRIFEVLSRRGELDATLAEVRTCFAGGLAAYRQQDWPAAQSQFETCLRLRPHDGPASVFLERLEQLQQAPSLTDWDGVWRLTHK